MEFNFAVALLGNDRARVVMPDILTGHVRQPTKGYLVRWPVNPHNTGKQMIERLLRGYEPFKDLCFV